MTLEEAHWRWPGRLAVGKMSIVTADGRPPRLVVDNSICGTNALCEMNETYTLPLLGSVRACYPLRGPPCNVAAVTIDIKSAHKTMSRLAKRQLADPLHLALFFLFAAGIYG